MSNSEILLNSVSHNGQPDPQAITGDKHPGDGYYGRSDGLHTVQYSLVGYQGTISIQATLATQPTEQDWFTVYTMPYQLSINQYTLGPQRLSNIINFTGNYVWIRAVLSEWVDGAVDFIRLNH